MRLENLNAWIEAGYQLFAYQGVRGLKVEPLAKMVGISKSSFYHHFADIELFIEALLEHHLKQSVIIGEKEQNARTIDPEIIQILVDHKTDLLFNRQLRVDQHNIRFLETKGQSNKIVLEGFKSVWKKDLNPSLTQAQIDGIFELALENFYMQITPENINYAWLSGYFKNLKQITQTLGTPVMDGSD